MHRTELTDRMLASASDTFTGRLSSRWRMTMYDGPIEREQQTDDVMVGGDPATPFG
jgi:hypothetical protein